MIPLKHFANLSRFDNLTQFVTTRNGGSSEGNYASFNLSVNSGDDVDNVRQNRRLLARWLKIEPEKLLFPAQVHGDKVLIVDQELMALPYDKQQDFFMGVDAMITSLPAVCLCVLMADCVPVLLYCPVKRVVGVVHAGWRGTVSKTAQHTVGAMCELFGCNPTDIVAGIGPAICEDQFEVDHSVAGQFAEIGFEMERISSVNPLTKKIHLNLWEANKELLLEAGVRECNIETMNICTFSSGQEFFSARRQGTASGRQAAGIMLNN